MERKWPVARALEESSATRSASERQILALLFTGIASRTFMVSVWPLMDKGSVPSLKLASRLKPQCYMVNDGCEFEGERDK